MFKLLITDLNQLNKPFIPPNLTNLFLLLNDDDDDFNPIENDQIDVVVNKIVKGGVYTVAVLIATVKTIRKIDRMMLEKLGNVIFRRSPGRRNYVSVPNDLDEEEELFGDYQDNLDDELEDAVFNQDDNLIRTPFADDVEEEEEEEHEGEGEQSNPSDERLFDIDDNEDEDEQHEVNKPTTS